MSTVSIPVTSQSVSGLIMGKIKSFLGYFFHVYRFRNTNIRLYPIYAFKGLILRDIRIDSNKLKG